MFTVNYLSMNRPSDYLLFGTLVKRSVFVFLLVACGVARASAQSTKHLTLEELRHVPAGGGFRVAQPGGSKHSQKKPHAAAHVKVAGVIGGNIRFELLLPDAWNGRFVMGGGGGFVGTVQNMAEFSVDLGYRTVGTDTDNEWQPGYSAGWALDNLEARLDFGYLAVHRTAEVAKALIRSYYGSDASNCYFIGCSRGGGQAMMEAQRFPQGFRRHRGLRALLFDWTRLRREHGSDREGALPDPARICRSHQRLTRKLSRSCNRQFSTNATRRTASRTELYKTPRRLTSICPKCRA